MREYQYALELAARGALPETIDAASRPSATIVRELVEAGYLKAIDASSLDGLAYLNPRITIAGREYLDQLATRRQQGEKERGEKLMGGLPGIDSAISETSTGWQEIERTYKVSKKTMGKRISFVRDEFKRKIIFRDIEQAFVLAEHGFSKPAVILAGGVIEELLRIYLEHRKVTPDGETLNSYLRACQTAGLLKTPIHGLANVLREFRNVVHLKREESSRYSISMATAKGAVASVFTIVHDFDK